MEAYFFFALFLITFISLTNYHPMLTKGGISLSNIIGIIRRCKFKNKSLNDKRP